MFNKSSQVNDVDRRRIQWASMSVSYLKRATIQLFNNFQCHTISSTSKVDSVIIFNILELQKLSSLD